jgi:transcriptional regulator with XRE-family HTH domain
MRAGISIATVNRILSGQEKRPTFDSVQAIARVLGVVIHIGTTTSMDEPENAFTTREKQAAMKARQLVRMVQGTMALESQAVESGAAEQMVKQTTCELLAGSPLKLWRD